MTKDGLKYRLPNEEIKMCVTKKDAMDWVKSVHEYQVPHLTKGAVPKQVHKGPLWWPTISPYMEHVIDECKICQNTTISLPKIENYGTIIFPNKKTHDWRELIIRYLKNPMELSNFAFHEEVGTLREELPHYFLNKEKLKQSFVNGHIKLCIFQEKKIE